MASFREIRRETNRNVRLCDLYELHGSLTMFGTWGDFQPGFGDDLEDTLALPWLMCLCSIFEIHPVLSVTFLFWVQEVFAKARPLHHSFRVYCGPQNNASLHTTAS